MDRWLLHGRIWADWTYRGINLGLYEFSTDLARSGVSRLFFPFTTTFLFCSYDKTLLNSDLFLL